MYAKFIKKIKTQKYQKNHHKQEKVKANINHHNQQKQHKKNQQIQKHSISL